MNNKLIILMDLTYAQLEDLVKSMGEPAYRAKQLNKWIYHNLASSINEMTDLPLAFHEKLEKKTVLHSLEPAREVTGSDGTVKVLFTLTDGATVESALMSYRQGRGSHRGTVCVSTQVGCAVGCPFCATGQQGFERNLTPGEIVDQVLYFARRLKKTSDEIDTRKNAINRLTNVVFMGMGEPLANYKPLWQAVETLNSPEGFGLGARNMTVSTAGLVPQIERLSREKLQVGLAVSLHASDNALRNRLVPINRKHPLEQIIPACRDYFQMTGRRVSFEYILFKGINDSIEQARALVQLLKGLNCHVNLIPANNTADTSFRSPSRQAVLAFERELKLNHVNVTVREPRGQDIDAGCGQLRSRYLKARQDGKEF